MTEATEAPQTSATIFVPAAELRLPEPRRRMPRRPPLAGCPRAVRPPHRSRDPPACSGLPPGARVESPGEPLPLWVPEKGLRRRSGACPKAPMSPPRHWPGRHRCLHGRSSLGCLQGYGVQRDEVGRQLPYYTPAENECKAGGSRTAEGACLHGRTEPTPTVYPPVWFPPLDFDSGIVKVGAGDMYGKEAAAQTGTDASETGMGASKS